MRRCVWIHKSLFPFWSSANPTEPVFKTDDMFEFTILPECKHSNIDSHSTTQATVLSPFLSTETDLITLCRPCSTLSKQFPHYSLSPMMDSSDPACLQRRLSAISLSSSSSSHHFFPPSSPTNSLKIFQSNEINTIYIQSWCLCFTVSTGRKSQEEWKRDPLALEQACSPSPFDACHTDENWDISLTMPNLWPHKHSLTGICNILSKSLLYFLYFFLHIFFSLIWYLPPLVFTKTSSILNSIHTNQFC